MESGSFDPEKQHFRNRERERLTLGHSRKNECHRIIGQRLVVFCVAYYFQSILEELALEKPVHEKKLAEHVEEAEEFAEEVPVS